VSNTNLLVILCLSFLSLVSAFIFVLYVSPQYFDMVSELHKTSIAGFVFKKSVFLIYFLFLFVSG
jgi:hypothetical protein